MPSALLLAPVGLLLAGSLVAWLGEGLGSAGVRPAAAAAAALALAALVLIWAPARGVTDLDLAQTGWGAQPGLRVDALTVAFGIAILVPGAALLALQKRTPRQAAAACALLAAAILAVESSSVVLTGFAITAGAAAGAVSLELEGPGAPPSWWVVMAAGFGVAWAGTLLQVLGGTSAYAAVPVSSFTPALCCLLIGAGIAAAGLLPGFGWPVALWDRPRLEAAGLLMAGMLPVGIYAAVRAYDLGGGDLPATWIGPALAALGTVGALVAALRGQAAATRRGHIAWIAPGLAALALAAAGLATPSGLAAAVTAALAIGAAAAVLPLVPDGGQGRAVLALAACAGLPPGLVFGARLLLLQAAVGSGAGVAFVAPGLAAAWLLALAGGARAIVLPAGSEEHDNADVRAGIGAVLILTALAGAGLGLIEQWIVAPATAALGLPFAELKSGGVLAVITDAGGWAALSLGLPLLILGAAVLVLRRPPPLPRRDGPSLEPLVALPRLEAPRMPGLQGLGFPDRAALEAVFAGRRPLAWAVMVAVLTGIVSR